LAVVAARSTLIGALLGATTPVNHHSAYSFLGGLSRGELECIAEFQGAYLLECADGAADQPKLSPYKLLSEFFDPLASDRWSDPDDRAHKTFVVLAWLEHLDWKIAVTVEANPAATV
jgi:hypothetical protein